MMLTSFKKKTFRHNGSTVFGYCAIVELEPLGMTSIRQANVGNDMKKKKSYIARWPVGVQLYHVEL